MPNQSLEMKTMRPDGPISAEQLAQLACALYVEMAPNYGLFDVPSWELLSPAQQTCMTAVTRRVLHRVDARVRYLLHAGYTGPLVGEADVTTPAENEDEQ